MRGVNLGNWLVLEKWMSPGLFEGTTADEETELCHQPDRLSEGVKRERFTPHRDEFVSDRDFAYLANHGVELIRLPVPWFTLIDQELYVGCADYVDRAFGWAEKYGLKVLIDLHTVPDSQTGSTTAACRASASDTRSPRTSRPRSGCSNSSPNATVAAEPCGRWRC